MRVEDLNNKKDLVLRMIKETYKLEDKKKWGIRKKAIELKLTNYCNRQCSNCNAGHDVVQTNDYLSLENMEKFVKESIASEYKWNHIVLVGGEPTLHPFFSEIIEILGKYRQFYSDCKFEIKTNGWGNKVQKVMEKIPEWMEILNTTGEQRGGVEGKLARFELFRIAPVDIDSFKGYEEFDKGCRVVGQCGLNMSVWGKYYPCSLGEVIARIFEIEIEEDSFADLLNSNIRNKLKKVCQYCGFFFEPGLFYSTLELQSESWDRALKEYSKKNV